MDQLLWICGAGALGTGARYLLSLWICERFGTGFPYGTLCVNLLGSFLMTFALQIFAQSGGISLNLRLAVTTGFLGGFTTYSSFNSETLGLLQSDQSGLAALNMASTVLGCLLFGFAGGASARLLFAQP